MPVFTCSNSCLRRSISISLLILFCFSSSKHLFAAFSPCSFSNNSFSRSTVFFFAFSFSTFRSSIVWKRSAESFFASVFSCFKDLTRSRKVSNWSSLDECSADCVSSRETASAYLVWKAADFLSASVFACIKFTISTFSSSFAPSFFALSTFSIDTSFFSCSSSLFSSKFSSVNALLLVFASCKSLSLFFRSTFSSTTSFSTFSSLSFWENLFSSVFLSALFHFFTVSTSARQAFSLSNCADNLDFFKSLTERNKASRSRCFASRSAWSLRLASESLES
mmetsp:Transcript_25177/g.63361  ORF Transcript_25177/g.63361 Transcript_25177/m.63361 type:complete len:279 (-) Transcript_25177:850-1686(-)